MIDFFHFKWVTEPSLSDKRFGIVDDGSISYTKRDGDEDDWDALVMNPQEKEVQFVPVDHHILVYESGNERSMCDGMLYTSNHDYVSFIEIKDRKEKWIEEAIGQLESTIAVFIANHADTAKGNRYAFACNPQHPQFAFSKMQRMQQFYHKYGFRLFVQREILVR